MTITTIQNGLNTPRVTLGPRPVPALKFSTVLASQYKSAITPSQEHSKALIADGAATAGDNGKNLPIALGKISNETPSVSHLLINHPDFRDQCWDILSSAPNQGKKFTNMQPGLEVYMDPASKEIIWHKTPPQPVSFANATSIDATTPDDSKLVNIGTINSRNPTLSHLLKNHPDYSNKTWDIVFSAVNRNKPYDALPLGTPVFINPKSLEVSFQEKEIAQSERTVPTINTPNDVVFKSLQAVTDSHVFSKKFADSVKTYLGKPYHKIDCYGLVVRGLEDIGVHYKGSDGLRQHLVQMATTQGLRHNAYHNGEGLIEAAGNKLFDESFLSIKNAEQQASEVMNKIKPLLQEGMLLSFSTPHRGHTGVISQKNGEWTYVNSGMIDHQVDGGKVAKRVGEETLSDEITNWFKLAKKKRTSLKVSAGIFDTEKLKDKARLAVHKPSEVNDLI